MPKSWLDHIDVHISEGLYLYHADTLCVACGQDAVQKAEAKGDYDTGDSDDFPQGPFIMENEADAPGHCGNGSACLNALKIPGGLKVGCPIKTFLTEEGIDYTRQTILDDILQPNAHPRRVGRLWFKLYSYSFGDQPLVKLTSEEIPTSLWKPLVPLTKQAILWTATWTDLAHIYGGAQSPDSMILWRLAIDDLGNFKDLRKVLLPTSEADERSLEDMLSEAVSSGAWDS